MAKAKAEKKTTPAKATKPKSSDEPKKYPEIKAERTLITPQLARDLLGWTPEAEGGEAYGDEYLLKDTDGNKVRCFNNHHNRPLYRANVEGLMQDMLNERWRFNGEPITVCDDGTIANGQHQLVAVVLAGEGLTDKNNQFVSAWRGKQFGIDKLIVYGVENSDDVLNTMDTAKPRSLTDVFYRSDLLPKKLKPSERRRYGNVMAFAVKTVWGRTGAGDDAFAPRRTHSESMDFYVCHKSLAKCVAHVWDEEGSESRLSRYLPLGTLSGLMYLFAASGTTDTAGYEKKRHEKYLDFEFLGKAEEFFTLLAGSSPDLTELRKAIAHFDDKGGCSREELTAVLCKCWLDFASDSKLKAANLVPKYRVDPDDGRRVLLENCTVHGIDKGQWSDPDAGVTDEEEPEEGDEAEAEVEDTAAEEQDGDGDAGEVMDEEAAEDEMDEAADEEYLPSPEEIEAAKKRLRDKKTK